MIDEKDFKKILIIVLVAVLVILAFFILKPILLSTIFGLILSFMFYPVHKKLISWVKSKNLSAIIICVGVIIIILIPLWFAIPLLVRQTFGVYTYLQKVDFSTPLENLFPSFASQEFSKNIIVAINSFVSNMTSSFLNKFSEILLNSPIILLHVLLILFVFFFGLRDGEDFVNYIQSLSPLSKESEKKVFKQFKDITQSVIFGQIIVGIAQGIVTGIGLFVFRVPNALILTLVATLVGVLPIIGPWLVWVPVDLWLFANNRVGSATGLLIYGLIVITWIDTVIRPFIVSKRTKINSAVILVSMVGGLFVFGVLGLIIGPLVISYLLLLLESYRSKKLPSLILEEAKK